MSIVQFQKSSQMRLIFSFFLLITFCGFSKAQIDPFYPSKINSSEIDSVYREAMIALVNAEHKKFFTQIEKVIEADSTCFKAFAHAAFQTYRISKGAEPFGLLAKRALGIDPHDWIDAAYSDVLKAQLIGQTDSVPKILEKMIKEHEAIEGYFLLGSFYADIGNLEAAHLNYFRAYRIDDSFAPIYYPLSKTSLSLGYPILSEEMFNYYVAMNSKHAKTCDVYGNYLMKKGDVQGAVEQFKMAHQLDNTYIFSLEKAEKLTRALTAEIKNGQE